MKRLKKPGRPTETDWDVLYKNPEREFKYDGDRNGMRAACSQYFKRKGLPVKIYSRYVHGKVCLMLVKLKS